jgi:hypothetical protein
MSFAVGTACPAQCSQSAYITMQTIFTQSLLWDTHCRVHAAVSSSLVQRSCAAKQCQHGSHGGNDVTVPVVTACWAVVAVYAVYALAGLFS